MSMMYLKKSDSPTVRPGQTAGFVRPRHSLGSRITAMSVCCILITVTVTALIIFTNSDSQIDSIVSADTQTSMTSFRNNLTDMNDGAAKCVSELVGNSNIRTVLNNGSLPIISMAFSVAVKNLSNKVDFITVTDGNGNVITCTSSNRSGEPIAGQKDIKAALSGNFSPAMLLHGSDVPLAVRAAAPVEIGGKIVAVVSAGYDLSTSSLLKTLQKDTGNDYSVFLGSTCLNTTLTQNGKTAAGAKGADGVVDQVQKKNRSYAAETDLFGSRYFARYEPLKDADGKTVGMLFVGKPTGNIAANRRRFLLLTILVAAVLSLLSILIFNLFSKKKIAEPIRSMSEMAAQLAAGNLAVNAGDMDSGDEIGLLSKSLQTMAANLRRYILDITEQLARISGGDMTSEFRLNYIGDFAPIREALLKISDSMNTTLLQIDRSAMRISSGAGQVSSISQTLASGVTTQVGSIKDLSDGIGGVSQKTSDTASVVGRVTSAVSKAAEDVDNSSRKAGDMLSAMEEIRQSSEKIEQIIKSIDGIAFQTNILSLNAAVEAARAGEAGRGFAVVADEVRRLAAKSAEASKQTAALIRMSQEKVKAGFSLAEETAKGARQINEILREIIRGISEIDAAAKEQAAGVKQIGGSIGKVSQVVQTNSATSEECAAASEELSGQAELLRSEVEKFRFKRCSNG